MKRPERREWFETFDERLWLRSDESGEEEARFIRDALKLRRGAAVLDAPCGAGRVAVHLARFGCRVTGVDLRELFIRRARARFRRERLRGSFFAQDLRHLAFDRRFAAICNWGGSFGYFSDEENLDLVRRYARALRPGGRLIIDLLNREHLLRHFARRLAHGRLTLFNRWDAARQRVHSTWVLRQDGRSRSSRLSMRFYTPRQMRDMLESAGFKVETLYGAAGRRWSRASRRMIAVARRVV